MTTATFDVVQPPDEYEIKGDGTVFVITPPAELQDDGVVVGYQGTKHRRPIEPEADVRSERAEVKAVTDIARTTERITRRERLAAAEERPGRVQPVGRA